MSDSAIHAASQHSPSAGFCEFEMPELGGGALLAIDTSLGTSVAVGVGGRVYRLENGDPRGHAEAIGGLMALVFELSGAAPAEIEGVVAGIGPGPFTGLRVGIAAAKAFATARGVPLLPLSGHDAVAVDAFERASVAGAGRGEDHAAIGVRVLQNAKRGENFATEYTGLDGDGLPVRLSDPHLISRSVCVTEARDVWPTAVPADQLIRLALRRREAGREFESDRALYLRSPDVYPAAAPKRVSR